MATTRPAIQLQQNSVKVLLIEQRQLLRAGLQRMLEDTGYVRIVTSASECDEAIRKIRKSQPDVILVSMSESAAGLLDGVRKLCRQFTKIRLLVMVPEDELVIQDRLLQFGIAGCIDNHCSLDELIAAIGVVCSGRRYISDKLAQCLAAYRLPGGQGLPFDKLTHRELQILILVAKGEGILTIARQLYLTQKTVNTYRKRLQEKLGVETDVGLVHLALQHGLVRLPSYHEFVEKP